MKKKYSRILGVALSLMLVASLFGFATPVSAGDVAWSTITNLSDSATKMNLADVDVGPIAVSPDGNTLFAPIITETPITGVGEGSGAGWTDADADGVVDCFALVQSNDGYTWTATGLILQPGIIRGIAISSNFDTDGTMYVASGNTVFRSVDKGVTFIALKPIVDSFGIGITAINSVAMWPGTPAYVMVGTNRDVLVLRDSVFEDWRDQELAVAGAWANAVAVAFAPDFATSNYIWAVVGNDSTATMLGNVTTTNSPGAWGTILANTGALLGVAALNAVIAFPDPAGYSSITAPYLWVGIDSGGANTGGIWRVRGLPAPGPSQAVKQYGMGITPAAQWDVRSLAVFGPMATATVIAGLQDAPMVVKSTNGGVTWPPVVFKQPTGGGAVFVVMAPDFATSNVVYLGNSAAADAYTITGPAGGETGTITVTAGSVLATPTGTALVNGANAAATITAGGTFTINVAGETVVVTAMTRATTVTWARTVGLAVAVTTTDWDGDIYDTILAAVITPLGSAVPFGNLILLPDDDSENAFQVSHDGGRSWSQTGLIDTPFTAINDIAVVSRDDIFVVSDNFSLWKIADASVRDRTWERILTPITATIPGNSLTLVAPATSTINLVETSPNFLSDFVVYATNNLRGIMKAIDGGSVFAPMGPPAGNISVMHVLDATFAFIGSAGQVYRTDDGAYSWLAATTGPTGTVTSIAIAPNYDTSGHMLVGCRMGWVYLSKDWGATFTMVIGAPPVALGFTSNKYVAFEPTYTGAGHPGVTGYSIYAAAGDDILRYYWVSEGWERIDGTIPTTAPAAAADSFVITAAAAADAGTITVAAGTVTATITDAGAAGGSSLGGIVVAPVPGSLTLTLAAGMGAVSFAFDSAGDTLTITATTAGSAGTWVRTAGLPVAVLGPDPDGDAFVAPNPAVPGTWSLPDVSGVGAPTASTINGLLTSPDGTLYASNLLGGQGVERSLNPTATAPSTLATGPVEGVMVPVFERMNQALATTAALTGLWLVVDETLAVDGSKNVLFSIDTANARIVTYTDTLATEVVVTSPENEAMVRETEAQLRWEALTGALFYVWQVAEDDLFTVGVLQNVFGYTGGTVTGLRSGVKYYWRVRVDDAVPSAAPGAPLLSRWSETRTFVTGLGARPWSPSLTNVQAVHGNQVPLKPGFQWTGADWATGYEFVLADNADLTSPLVSTTVSTTAYASTVELKYSTTYFWQVRAVSNISGSEWSDVGTFTTMAEPEEPTPPVVIQEVPDIIVEPTPIEVPPAVEATPTWALLVIIIIGAVLVVSVIVLILRTRRPI